jgi:hypothetical protein
MIWVTGLSELRNNMHWLYLIPGLVLAAGFFHASTKDIDTFW